MSLTLEMPGQERNEPAHKQLGQDKLQTAHESLGP